MKAATKALNDVTEGGALNCPDDRVFDRVKIGQVIRQGDIYIHAVDPDHPRGERREDRKLAVGDTQGARHILEGSSILYEGVTAPEWIEDERVPLGPLFVVEEGTVERVSHPEHANLVLPQNTYQVTHQMNARTWRRVMD